MRQSINRTHDTESFVAKSKARYGQQFSYQEAVYIDARTQLTLYCLRHSPVAKFEVTPDRHFRKKGGCRQCKADGARSRHGKGRDAFIAEALAMHGEAFDYSAVEYVNARTSVEIYCRMHKIHFEQIPQVHLKGGGCSRCKGTKISEANEPLYARKRVLFAEFLVRARKKHSDYYQYDEASYNGFNRDVTIICPEHGPFPQRAKRHTDGSGCKRCSSENLKLTEQIWRSRIQEKFGSTLTVTLDKDWSGRDTETQAYCSPHNLRWGVKAYSLLTGNGCRYCTRREKNAPRLDELRKALPEQFSHLRSSESPEFLEFVIASVKRHATRYSYPEEQFLSMSRCCEIVCEKHKSFRILPRAHLDGQGCRVCEFQYAFLDKAMAQFGDRYDYSHVAFTTTNAKEKVTVRCIAHNISFSQSADVHLRGTPFCPQCKALRRAQSTAQRRERNQHTLIQSFEQAAFKAHAGKYQYPALGRELITWGSKITVYCPEHQYTFTPSAAVHIQKGKRSPAGCQRCKGDASRLRYRNPYQQVKKRLAEHGFKLLVSEEDYMSQRESVFVRCNEGHERNVVPQKIFSGRGCPDCSPHVGEEITRSILESVLRIRLSNRHFLKKDYPELVAPHAYLELDGYNSEHQIAFEYQGAWHSQRRCHKTEDSYLNQLQRDEQKKIMCRELDISLIEVYEFNYPFQANDVRKKVTSALINARLSQHWTLPDPLPLQAHTPLIHAQGLKSLLELAKAHNLTVKEKAWRGKSYRYTWTCNTCSYMFKTQYTVRLNAKWAHCPRCVSRDPAVRAQARVTMSANHPRHLEALREKALRLGLTLLDTEWKTSKPGVTYRFSCIHTKQEVTPRTYNNILKGTHGCRCEAHRQMQRATL